MKTEKTLINDMTSGSLVKQLVIFAFPLIIANLLQSLYNTVDMVVVGQLVGAESMAAVSTGGEMFHFFTNMAAAFSMGGQIMIAQHVGAGDRKGIQECIGTIFSFILFLSLVLMTAGLILHRPFLALLNTPPESVAEANRYVFISCVGLPCIAGYNCVSAVLRGMGDSRHPLIFIAVATGMNLVLDILLVGAAKIGAAGAALATVISQGFSVAVSMIFLYRHRDAFGFDFKLSSFRPHKKKLITLIKVGTPLAAQHLAINISQLFVTANINAYGVTASAVFGVGNRIHNISSIISGGFSGAGGTMIGQNLAAGKPERAKRVVYVCLAISGTLMAFHILLALLIPRQIFSLFNTDPAVLEMSVRFMRIQCWAFLGSALMGPYGAMVTGSGFAVLGLAIGIFDGVVARVGLSLLLGEVLGMGLDGYFYANALARLGSAAIQMIYFYSGRWRTRRLLVDKQPALAGPEPEPEGAS